MDPALPHDAERQVHAPAARRFLAQPLQHDALVGRRCVHQELVVAHRVVAELGERAACGWNVLEPFQARRDLILRGQGQRQGTARALCQDAAGHDVKTDLTVL